MRCDCYLSIVFQCIGMATVGAFILVFAHCTLCEICWYIDRQGRDRKPPKD
jgi:hypothetical protein